jgi:hypothetical protein
MVITYFWILETTTGATWRSGYLRIVSLAVDLLTIHQLNQNYRPEPFSVQYMATS